MDELHGRKLIANGPLKEAGRIAKGQSPACPILQRPSDRQVEVYARVYRAWIRCTR